MKLKAAALVFLIPCAAFAGDAKQGWGLQFRQDTFDKTVFPIAMMSQDGTDFDKALIGVACGKSGKLVSFFQSGMIISFDKSVKAEFVGNGSPISFTFEAAEIPHLGSYLSLNEQETEKLLSLFQAGGVSEVSFRSDKKQGVFSTIAAQKTFELVKSNCDTK